jgi:hypothetical protein
MIVFGGEMAKSRKSSNDNLSVLKSFVTFIALVSLLVSGFLCINLQGDFEQASINGNSPHKDVESAIIKEASLRLNIPEQYLSFVGNNSVNFLYSGINGTTYKIRDIDNTIGIVLVEANGKIFSRDEIIEIEERNRTSVYGKKNDDLYKLLKKGENAGRINVTVWLKTPSFSGAEIEFSKKYKDLKLDSQAYPTSETNISSFQSHLSELLDKKKEITKKSNTIFISNLHGRFNVEGYSDLLPVVYLSIKANQISELEVIHDVSMISYEPSKEFKLQGNTSLPAAGAYYGWDRGFTGNGVKIGIVECGAIDYNNPYIVDGITHKALSYVDNAESNSHATWVAGIIASTHPIVRGGAYGVQASDLYSIAFGNRPTFPYWQDALFWGINNGIRLFSNSYDCGNRLEFDGINTEYLLTHYSDYDATVDYLSRNYFATFVFASGNAIWNGHAWVDYQVDSPAHCYNAITVGATDDRNTFFQSDDQIAPYSCYVDPLSAFNDRNKPEVCAPSGYNLENSGIISTCDFAAYNHWMAEWSEFEDGTSFSSPVVVSELAQLYQYKPALTYNPAVNKAIIIASAIYHTPGNNEIDPVNMEGAGTISFDKSYEAADNAGYTLFGTSSYDFQINVPNDGKQTHRIKAAISWLHDGDNHGEATTIEQDCDLYIETPSGEWISQPTGHSHDNNYEWLDFTTSQTGTFTARILRNAPIVGSVGVGYSYTIGDIRPFAAISDSFSNVPGNTQAHTARVGDTISFSGASSYDPDGTIPQVSSSYQWNFGDGTTTSGVSVTHDYHATGTYKVVLTVTDSYGSTGYSWEYVNINPPAAGTCIITSITPNPAYQSENIVFSARGTTPDGGPITACLLSSNIDGDLKWLNAPIAGWNSPHDFSLNSYDMKMLSPGTHTISFKIQDEYYQWSPAATMQLTVQAVSIPVARIVSLSPNPAYHNQAVEAFGTYAVSPSLTAELYLWGCNDCNFNYVCDNSVPNPLYCMIRNLQPGTHQITFMIRDSLHHVSAKDTKALTILPNQAPVAHIDSITPTTQYVGHPVSLTGHGSDIDGTIIAYKWRSNINGVFGALNTITTDSLSVGIHTIFFSVQDDDGIWSPEVQATLTIFVDTIPPIIEGFSINGGASSTNSQFTTLSIDATDQATGVSKMSFANSVDTEYYTGLHLTLDSWNHIEVFVYPNDRNMHIFLNGQSAGWYGLFRLNDPTSTLLVGTLPETTSFFMGYYDDLQIYCPADNQVFNEQFPTNTLPSDWTTYRSEDYYCMAETTNSESSSAPYSLYLRCGGSRAGGCVYATTEVPIAFGQDYRIEFNYLPASNSRGAFTLIDYGNIRIGCIQGVDNEITIPDGSWSAWEQYSPSKNWVLTNGNGIKTVYCRVMDSAGNIAQTQDTITLDTIAPSCSITTPSSSPTYVGTNPYTLMAGTAADNVGIAYVTWSSSLDPSHTFTCTGTTSWTIPSIALNYGTNVVITVTSHDAAGNTASVATTIIFDNTPPTVAITTPTSGPTWYVDSLSGNFYVSGSFSEDLLIDRVEILNTHNGMQVENAISGSNHWIHAVTLDLDVENTIIVTAFDKAGNAGQPATLTIKFDHADPVCTIISPTTDMTYYTNQPAVTLGGTASDNGWIDRVEWWNQANDAYGTASGTTSWTVSGIPLEIGANTISVYAYDGVGRFCEVLITVYRDTTPPTFIITTPTSNPLYVDSGCTGMFVAGSYSEDLLIDRVDVLNTATGARCTNAINYDGHWLWKLVLEPGVDNIIIITAYDKAGNSAQVTLTVIHDGEDPVCTIVTPTTDGTCYSNQQTITLGGTASDNILVDRVEWWNQANDAYGTASGTSSWTVADIPLVLTGPNTISVYAFDEIGRYCESTITVYYDITPPTVAITTPTSDTGKPYYTGWYSILLSGSFSDETSIDRIDGLNTATGAHIAHLSTPGLWVWNHVYLNPGANEIIITAYDKAGNSAEARLTIISDMESPICTITSPTSDPTFAATDNWVDLSGTSSDSSGVSSITWTNAATGESGTATGATSWAITGIPLIVGGNEITVTAIDLAGNSGDARITVLLAQTTSVATINEEPSSSGWYVSGKTTISLGVVDTQSLLSMSTDSLSGTQQKTDKVSNVTVYYRIDGGAWQTYKNPLKHFDDGIHLIEYYSVDQFGVPEGINFFTLKVDSQLPIKSGVPTWTQGDEVDGVFTLSWAQSNDATSGLKCYILQQQSANGGWTTLASDITKPGFQIGSETPLAPGTYYFRICAVDIAGNVGHWTNAGPVLVLV